MPSDHKEDFLDFLADCQWMIEHDADTDANGRQVDCSTFSITGSLRSFEIFLSALGIEHRPDLGESLEDALKRAIASDQPKPADLTEECSHRWVVLPSDKSMVVCTDCGVRYGAPANVEAIADGIKRLIRQTTRYPTSNSER